MTIPTNTLIAHDHIHAHSHGHTSLADIAV